MEQLEYTNNRHHTPANASSLFGKLFPSFSFYTSFMAQIYLASRKAQKGAYDNEAWFQSSINVFRALERTGLKISMSGIEHLKSLDSPCVIIGNHVSMMETIITPVFVIPDKPMTFIIKKSLLDYPVFKHVMRSRNPIALGRENPREDLKKVFSEGQKRLKDGVSVVVFPQTTRGVNFDPRQFNSIGVKLALKAGVPVLPLALKTDAWTNGKLIKDLGRIHPQISTHFCFDAPITVEGKGKEAHQQVVDFISGKLKEWQ